MLDRGIQTELEDVLRTWDHGRLGVESIVPRGVRYDVRECRVQKAIFELVRAACNWVDPKLVETAPAIPPKEGRPPTPGIPHATANVANPLTYAALRAELERMSGENRWELSGDEAERATSTAWLYCQHGVNAVVKGDVSVPGFETATVFAHVED